MTTRALLLRVSGSHCQQPHREGQGGLPATELRSGRDPLSGAVRGDAGATPDPRCDRAATVFFRDPAPNARTHANGAPIPHGIDQATLESTRSSTLTQIQARDSPQVTRKIAQKNVKIMTRDVSCADAG